MGRAIATGLPCSVCSSSDAMAEYANGYYCYSCHTNIPKKTKTRTARMNKNIHPKYLNEFSKTFPDNIKAYLYKHHFTNEMIDDYPLEYCSNYLIYSSKVHNCIDTGPRLVFNLLRHDDTLEAKRFGNHDLKYVTYGKKQALISKKKDLGPYVIVEDLLSFFRIDSAGFNCCCLRGTQLSDETMIKLKEKASTFIVWLDGDKPGQAAAEKIQNRLSFIGKAVILKTKEDPKCYSDKDIKEYILNAEHLL